MLSEVKPEAQEETKSTEEKTTSEEKKETTIQNSVEA
jgi:hypothetical protein